MPSSPVIAEKQLFRHHQERMAAISRASTAAAAKRC
jgi:hypothetical protein